MTVLAPPSQCLYQHHSVSLILTYNNSNLRSLFLGIAIVAIVVVPIIIVDWTLLMIDHHRHLVPIAILPSLI